MEKLQGFHHLLLEGDCFELLEAVEPGTIDLLVTDPPYGTTAIAWDRAPDLDRLWPLLRRAVKPSGLMLFFSSQPFTTDLINSNRAEFRYELIWEKNRATGFLDAHNKPMKSHENVLVFCQIGIRVTGEGLKTTYNPQKEKGASYVRNHKKREAPRAKQYRPAALDTVGYTKIGEGRLPKSVLHFSEHNGNSPHPTAKPVALLEYLIRTYSSPGETVLDPFAGGGSAGVAAANTGRRFLGFEMSTEYAKIARKRIDAASRQEKLDLAQ